MRPLGFMDESLASVSPLFLALPKGPMCSVVEMKVQVCHLYSLYACELKPSCTTASAAMFTGFHYSSGTPFVKRARQRAHVGDRASINITPITTDSPTTSRPKRKRPRVGEDPPPLTNSTPAPHSYASFSLECKINRVLELCQHVDLPFHTFIYQIFRTPNAADKVHWTEDPAVTSVNVQGQSPISYAESLGTCLLNCLTSGLDIHMVAHIRGHRRCSRFPMFSHTLPSVRLGTLSRVLLYSSSNMSSSCKPVLPPSQHLASTFTFLRRRLRPKA